MMIYLASQSARRRQLLAHLGVPFQPLDTEVDETALSGEKPAQMAVRLAHLKALAGLKVVGEKRSSGDEIAPGSVVLAADTLVDLDGEPLGKPASVEQARQMLTALCGRPHSILTALAVVNTADDPATATPRVELASTEVWMHQPGPGWIEYCANHPEALRCAGAYAIQGAAAPLVQCINGCFYTIVGLPLAVTARLLGEFGLSFRPELVAPDGAFGTPDMASLQG